MNWLYPLLALGTLTALAGGAYLYVRWRDMKAMREFARRYREAEFEKTTNGWRCTKSGYSPVDSVDSPQPKP